MAGFGCLTLFIHFTVSSVVRSYLQSQLKKCLQFNSILGLEMPQIELLLLFWALGKWGRNVSAEPQDRMALLQVWGGQPQEECKLVGSLLWALQVHSYRSNGLQNWLLWAAASAAGNSVQKSGRKKKKRNVFGRKCYGLTLGCKQLVWLIPFHDRCKIRQKITCWVEIGRASCRERV